MKRSTSITGVFRKLMNSMASLVMMAAPVGSAAATNDGYIESEGSLGFNTSYYVGPNTKLELDFQLTSLVANTNSTGYTDLNERLMAIESPYDVSSYATNLPRFIVYLGFYDNKPKLSFKGSAADGSPQARNLYDADLGRHTMVIDIPASSDHFKVFTDGVQSFASGNTYGAFLQKTATIPLALFGETECSNPDRSGNTFPNRPQLGYSYQNRSKMKVFGFKCYEKENGEYVLKRNFVPCLKGGVPGFKDEVSGYFFTGENVDTVKYGGNIMVVKDDPYLSTGPYNSVAKAAAAGECIYIDTGYYPKTTSRIELDFAPLTPNSWTSSTKYAHDTEFLYTEHSSGTYYAYEIDGMNSKGYIGVKVGNADYRYVARLCDAYNIRRTISLSSNSVVMVVSGCTNYVSVITTPGYGFLADSETTLRIVASSATGNYYSPMKVYGLKIYESDVLIKDLRPTVTNGVSCLVDACNPANVCYTTPYNGDTHRLMFEAGGDIACTDGSDEAYLEFNGAGNIDTGCIVSNDSRIDVDLSLWDANNGGDQQFLLWQEPAINSGVVAYLYTTPERFAYRLSDCTAQSGFYSSISPSNDRRQFTLDGPNGKFTVRKGGEVELDQAMDGTRTLSNGGSATLHIGNSKCRMRLYSFKVTTNGNVVRDFVPCVTNGVAGLYDLVGEQFYPLTGGKVCGKGTKGKSEFVVSPQPMRIVRNGTGALKCLAAGARSYEWYDDGNLIEGETGDSLTLEWTRQKPHVRTYSVRPVYAVFNETVRGEAATVQVEFIPPGTSISIR